MIAKVLLVRSDLKLAGPGRLMLSNAQALRELDVDCVFASSGGALTETVRAAGFQHVRLPTLSTDRRSPIDLVRASTALAALCLRERFDVVHSYNAAAGALAMPGATLTGAVVINTVLGSGKERWLRRAPFPLVAVSHAVREKLSALGVPADRIHVIHNATLDDDFLLAEGRLDELSRDRNRRRPIIATSVAMLTGQKGHAEVVRALQCYMEDPARPRLRVVFVGDGAAQPELIQLASDLGVSDLIDFAGAQEDVRPFLDGAHLFVHLPDMETFGIAVAEAGARGLPSIVANVGGLPEVVVDGETGVLVEAKDPQAVAEQLASLAADSERRTAMGMLARQRAERLFHRRSSGRALLALYESASRR